MKEAIINKLQILKEKYNSNDTIRLLSICFIIFIFLFIIIKIIMGTRETDIQSIPLIKSEFTEIKTYPVNNKKETKKLNIYDVVENKQENFNNVSILKEEYNILKLQDNNNINEDDSYNFFDDQKMLSDKINEMTDDEIVVVKPIEKNNKKEVIEVKENNKNKLEPNIKTTTKKVTNVEELSKSGKQYNSIIKNIKRHLDKKPTENIFKVQLLATKNRDSAIEYWNNLKHKYTDLFKDKEYYVESKNVQNVGYIYKLQVGNFDNEKGARDFCDKYVKNANIEISNCILVK